MTLIEWRDAATIAGVVIALSTLIKSAFEYTKQGAQKRAEQFENLRIRFKDDPMFRRICDLLEHDDPKLEAIAFKEKRDFLGFFEEVALMVNSGLMKPSVAHYMFGYYAIKCWQSDNFWNGVNRNSPYWWLFRDFAQRMSETEKKFRFVRRNYRF
jgi:hypothetical protein